MMNIQANLSTDVLYLISSTTMEGKIHSCFDLSTRHRICIQVNINAVEADFIDSMQMSETLSTTLCVLIPQ